MSQLDSLLNAMLGVFAYSIFVVPIALLVIVAVLYFYKPHHRLVVSVIALTLGSLGLAIYLGMLVISLYEFSGKMTSLSIFFVIVEILTMCVGVASLIKRNPK